MTKRQRGLPLARLDSVAVAGAGGIGSWVAYYLAISRLVNRLELIDFDYLEPHNLNRTPYRPEHVGMLKVRALEEVVKTANPEVEVVAYDEPLERVVDRLESGVLVEATDSLSLRGVLESWLSSGRKLVTVHYDGESITIGVNVVPGAWGGEETGYATAPVYVATPAIAAGLVVHILTWRGSGSLLEGRYTFRATLSDIVKSFVAWEAGRG